MQIKHHYSNDDGIFYIVNEGKRMGDMRYMISDSNKMDIYHIEVDPQIEGQNWGSQLIEAAVNYAREKHLKIIPSCTFAKTVFTRHKEYHDVLA
ncbi:GNAT family N-acetyltransferase [Mucilaginibacter terrae]|uniref:GNAT family N-acetyltransferase n=1 Tax=Mucilaginibacter terrae TaxID=1955052 RepID=UPI003641E065